MKRRLSCSSSHDDSDERQGHGQNVTHVVVSMLAYQIHPKSSYCYKYMNSEKSQTERCILCTVWMTLNVVMESIAFF
jgi:hypothetical protein